MLFNDQTLWKLDRTAQKALQLSTAFAVLGKKLGVRFLNDTQESNPSTIKEKDHNESK